MNKIGICSDHAGYEVKELVKSLLIARGLEVKDFGCPSPERCDYPDYAHPMGRLLNLENLPVAYPFADQAMGSQWS